MTAPVVLLPHDWGKNVVRKLSWKTDILRTASGAEQRRRLRVEPIETLTYSVTITGPHEASALSDLVLNTTDWRVQMPRWEDAVRVALPLAIGDTAVTILEDSTRRQLLGAALLFMDVNGEQTAELVTVDDATGTAITLQVGVVADWPAGCLLIPLMTGYLTGPVAGDDAHNLLGTVQFTFEVEEDISGITDGGDAVTMVPASINVGSEAVNQDQRLYPGDIQGIYAEVFDANGILIPNADVTFTSMDPDLAVYPTGMPNTANVKNLKTGNSGVSLPVEVTAGSVTVTYYVALT